MADELDGLAIGWHVVMLVVVAAIIGGWRPSRRTAALLLVAVVLSVSVSAFAYGNPFNGMSFGLLALSLAAAAVAGRRRTIAAGPAWAFLVGAVLVVYASSYPAFSVGPWYRALYAAPVGVIPCPTLALAAGFTLMAGGFGSRAIPALLALWCAFYAVFGIFRLGVIIDAGLLAATLGLVMRNVTHVEPDVPNLTCGT